MSYASLKDYAFFWPYWSASPSKYDRYVNGEIVESGSRTTAGRFGAMESKLYKNGHLRSEHHDVSLSEEELRRITLWLDCNSNELGAYVEAEAQRNGELIWPGIDIDPDDFHNGEVSVTPLPIRSINHSGRFTPQTLCLISLKGVVLRKIFCMTPADISSAFDRFRSGYGTGTYIVKSIEPDGISTKKILISH